MNTGSLKIVAAKNPQNSQMGLIVLAIFVKAEVHELFDTEVACNVNVSLLYFCVEIVDLTVGQLKGGSP